MFVIIGSITVMEVIIGHGTAEEVLIKVNRTVGDITTTKKNEYKWCLLFIMLRTINILKSNK
jgi:hypothetical protein